MTESQFNELKLGDKIYDSFFNDIGTIVMGSYREWYAEFPSRPDGLVMYDPVEDDCPWDDITINYSLNMESKNL